MPKCLEKVYSWAPANWASDNWAPDSWAPDSWAPGPSWIRVKNASKRSENDTQKECGWKTLWWSQVCIAWFPTAGQYGLVWELFEVCATIEAQFEKVHFFWDIGSPVYCLTYTEDCCRMHIFVQILWRNMVSWMKFDVECLMLNEIELNFFCSYLLSLWISLYETIPIWTKERKMTMLVLCMNDADIVGDHCYLIFSRRKRLW